MTEPRRPGDERLKALATRLNVDLEAGPPRGDSLLVWRFVPMETGLPGWRSEGVRPLPIADTPPMTRSAWRPAEASEDDVLLLLDTIECADAADARGWLLRVLAGVESTANERPPERAPGDVAVGMPGGGMLAFTRANLVCVLRNGGRSVRSVIDPAAALDGWVADLPEPGGRVPPEIRRVEAGPAGPEGEVALDVEAGEPAERAVWFKLVAQGGQLRLEERGPIFRPARRGRRGSVRVYVVGPGGVAAESIDIGGG